MSRLTLGRVQKRGIGRRGKEEGWEGRNDLYWDHRMVWRPGNLPAATPQIAGPEHQDHSSFYRNEGDWRLDWRFRTQKKLRVGSKFWCTGRGRGGASSLLLMA